MSQNQNSKHKLNAGQLREALKLVFLAMKELALKEQTGSIKSQSKKGEEVKKKETKTKATKATKTTKVAKTTKTKKVSKK